ncbi:PREDICTED: anthocyanidin reductase-like [Nelumbo nucifera]|uniref:Anthocyanidin reductase-like n=1 Tax=Nelumbo nucifera TaxID=4432 RepID=A0A1U7ZT16_NELNU|nr:PREDICTED: anthocyanidin reductase-like [Nelumbo nucifera]
MTTMIDGKKRACVTGGTGYMASLLVKLLLERGYAVNTTCRCPDNQKKMSHLLELQASFEELRIFRADLTQEGSFDTAVAGCDFVFHVATPMNFTSKDPEKDMIKPAVQGTLNVLRACAKSNTVKRVIYTSSLAASMGRISGTGTVIDEGCWTDVELLASEKPPGWGYSVSKTLAEKAAWDFAKENNTDLIAILPPLIVGPSLTLEVSASFSSAMAFLTRNQFLINSMKNVQKLSGSRSISHVEDVCQAHIFVAEKESVSGRYICCAVNITFLELANYLNRRYPEYNVPTDFGDFFEKAKAIYSSEKLINEGFRFKYGIEEIYDQAVDYFKTKGLLPK